MSGLLGDAVGAAGGQRVAAVALVVLDGEAQLLGDGDGDGDGYGDGNGDGYGNGDGDGYGNS
jgi:hypothetical protein